MLELKNFGVVILAAGESSRMNVPKPFLRYNSNFRFIDKIIDEYMDFGINNIVVVGNNNINSKLNLNGNVSVVVNEHLDYERFYSIKLGIEKIRNCEFCYIQNIDNPFVNEVILRKLYFKRIVEGSTIPVFNEQGGHPVLLGKDVIKSISEKKELNLNFRDIVSEFPDKKVEIDDESILININTPEEYQKYFN
ncbi:MAG: hypothetical protein EPN82_12145 [Bacteroidetes bacterium]|nr:MAG: hypothetical protein EPN82_12145 [Bacteroidota bacterium]